MTNCQMALHGGKINASAGRVPAAAGKVDWLFAVTFVHILDDRHRGIWHICALQAVPLCGCEVPIGATFRVVPDDMAHPTMDVCEKCELD